MKCYFPFIAFYNPNIVVGILNINLREIVGALGSIKDLRDKR